NVFSRVLRRRVSTMRTHRILKVAAAAFATLAIVLALDSKQAKADDNAIAEAWILAWNSHDPDAVVAVFTEDVFLQFHHARRARRVLRIHWLDFCLRDQRLGRNRGILHRLWSDFNRDGIPDLAVANYS